MAKKKKTLRMNFFLYFYIQILNLNQVQKFELNITLEVNKNTILQVINIRNSVCIRI